MVEGCRKLAEFVVALNIHLRCKVVVRNPACTGRQLFDGDQGAANLPHTEPGYYQQCKQHHRNEKLSKFADATELVAFQLACNDDPVPDAEFGAQELPPCDGATCFLFLGPAKGAQRRLRGRRVNRFQGSVRDRRRTEQDNPRPIVNYAKLRGSGEQVRIPPKKFRQELAEKHWAGSDTEIRH